MLVLPNKCVYAVIFNVIPEFSHVYIRPSPNTRGTGNIKMNRYFKNKEKLMMKMKKWALELNFEYIIVSSNKSRVIL